MSSCHEATEVVSAALSLQDMLVFAWHHAIDQHHVAWDMNEIIRSVSAKL